MGVVARSEMLIRINTTREADWMNSLNTNATIVMPSHILETFNKTMVSFLAKSNRKYIVDPMTHVFSDPRRVEGKQWFSKLSAKYGIPMVRDSNDRKLSPDALVGDDCPSNRLEKFVENVMNYQRRTILKTVQDISEFMDFESDVARPPTRQPRWIIPPYFFIKSSKSEWMGVNTEAARLAVAHKLGKEKVFAAIMLDSACMMDGEVVDSIVDAYDIDGLDGYMLWPVQLDENSATKPELSGFLRFVCKLSGCGRPIYNMYGGLLSFMMLKHGMAGVSHSIGYGEYRIPFVEGGKMSSVRFYQPCLHSQVPLARKKEIERVLDLERCACKHCASIDDSEYDMALAGKHFLEIRESEVREISDDPDAFLKKLAAEHNAACEKDQKGYYAKFYNRLGVWKSVMDVS